MNDNYIKKIQNSFNEYYNRNLLLIKYCKNLMNNIENNDKNYNLISTIRSLSIPPAAKKFKKYLNNDIINYYDDNNIITFNNNLKYEIKLNKYRSYFESEKIIKNGKYYLGELINKGKFSEVYKGIRIKDKKLVAIKKISLENYKIEDLENEINVLKEMNNCEYSVKYYDSFKKNNTYYIITELCDDNLRKEIDWYENGFSTDYIKKIFCQLNEGLKYLRNKNLFHSDIKPENILINKINKDNNKYKLCDYGFCKYFEKSTTKLKNPLYSAPETKLRLEDTFKISDKSDLFSNKFKDLIEKCTNIDYKNRIDWNDYFNHPFFNYEIEIILEIKEWDLNKNIKLIDFDNKLNNDNTELYVNYKKESFKNEYKFNKIGNHVIKFIFKIILFYNN